MSDTLTVGFSNPRAWFSPYSWLIKAVDRAPFSHAYVRLTLDGKDVVYQASGLKVNFEEYSIFTGHAKPYAEFPFETDRILEIDRFCLSHVGAPYSIKEALGLGLVKMARLVGRDIRSNPFKDDSKEFFCSEMVARILMDFFGAPFTDDSVELMTPSDLYNYLVAHPVGVQK